MESRSTASIRRKVLKDRGVKLEKHTRKPQPLPNELPSSFSKTPMMKYLEIKHGTPIEQLIFEGSIYKAGKKLGVNPSTISKWRKAISELREKEFWEQFNMKEGVRKETSTVDH